jgi:energy-coupling factor transporter ATP-binding protein EcfA2
MLEIDLEKLKWVKNIKRDSGADWAYFDEYIDNTFNLHWPVNKGNQSNQVERDDIILLFQNYRNKGIVFSHLVRVIDDAGFMDATNSRMARRVEIIHRSKNIHKPEGYKFTSKAFGQACNLSTVNQGLTIAEIRQGVLNVFYEDYSNTFRKIVNPDGTTTLNLPTNKLFNLSQNVSIAKNILTLIGQNGCGKSAILESVYSNSFRDESLKYICFSSGQNELFSNLSLQNIRRVTRSLNNPENDIDSDGTYSSPINSFYMNNNWVRLLIAGALAFKREGAVSKFINDKGYAIFNNHIDQTSNIKIPLRIHQSYRKKVELEKLREEEGTYSTFLHGGYHETVDRIVNRYFDDFQYQRNLKEPINIPIKDFSTLFNDSIDLFFNVFWVDSVRKEKVFDIQQVELFLQDFELSALSDGEYQLLAIYSLIDLFDDANTVFLLDEIDSHLYFENIHLLWSKLNEINSFVITTTHVADSIVFNHQENIRLVDGGKIVKEYTLNSTISRLNKLSSSKDYEFKVASNVQYLVLIDNVNDWIAFKQLAAIKCHNYNEELISKIHVINHSEGADTHNDVFGNSKLEWVNKLKNIDVAANIKTKNIFMICDRDNHPLSFCANGVQVTGSNKKVQFGNGGNAYLLSWKRKQIENYFISHSLANQYNIIDAINDTVLPPDRLRPNEPMDCKSIQDAEVKDIVKTLYCHAGAGLDINLRKEVLSNIPVTEVSDDIENMYNFIISKIN